MPIDTHTHTQRTSLSQRANPKTKTDAEKRNCLFKVKHIYSAVPRAPAYLTGLRIELESAWKNSLRRREEELMLSLPLVSSPSW